ncbi:MAG: hypothetical protein WA792_05380 [Pseudolabrys sp.]|jgi:hypothetical protein
MRRVGLMIVFACLLAAAGTWSDSAKAGEYGYYGDGYHRHYSGNVWYSSNCCYRRVVRHSAHYEHLYGDGYYPRHGYYDSPYRSSYYGPSYRSGGYYGRPYYGDSYRPRGYAYGYGGHVGYGGYDSYDCSAYSHRVKVYDGRGGWVWGGRAGCY